MYAKAALFLLLTLTIGAAIFGRVTPQNTSPALSPLTIAAKTPKETVIKNLDATKQLIMMEDPEGDSTVYTFFVADGVGANRQVLFARTAAAGVSMSVPANSWSPDSRFVFLKEESVGTGYLVFRSSGEAFADSTQFIDVLSLFTSKLPEYELTDITGWAGDGLLLVKTKTVSGVNGPSFWFDVSSRSFLQLAR